MRRISHEPGRRLMRVSLVRTRFTVGRSVVMSLALGGVIFLGVGGASSGGFTNYPDLIAEAPGAAHLEIDVWPIGDPADPEDCLIAYQGDCRLLMQFDGLVTNVGDGPIHIEGNPQLSGNVAGQVA